MKRILFFLLLGVCLGLKAADRDDSKYLAGAVPEVNGVVTFEKQFKVPGQTDDQIRNTLMTYVKESLVKNAIEGLRTRVISDGTTGEPICARIEEMMVFKNVFNDWYARDTSKKIRAVFNAKGKSGKPLTSHPPYGYKKSEADKFVWEVDEEV